MIARVTMEAELVRNGVNFMMYHLGTTEVTVNGEAIEMFESRGRTYFYVAHSSGVSQIADAPLELAQAIYTELLNQFEL